MSTATKTRTAKGARRRTHQAKRHTPAHRKAARRRSRSPLVFLAGGVVLLGIAAAVLTGSRGTTKGAPITAPVQITGATLPAFSRTTGTDPAVGKKAPQVRGIDFARDPIAITHGRPTVIVFLAHWCPHCRNDVPAVTAWLKDRPVPPGIDFFAVSTWVDPSRPNYPPATWLEEENWPVPTLVDDEHSSVGEAFGLRGTPFWVVIGADGTVLGRVEAELGGPGLERVFAGLRT